MEKIWTNFDEESKTIVNELPNNNKSKFSKLVSRLNDSKNNMNKNPESIKSVVQSVK